MEVAQLADQLDRLMLRRATTRGSEPKPALAPGLRALRCTVPTDFESTIYDPLVCLILQGRKETRLGARGVEVRTGDCIVVSHDLPVISRITEAHVDRPYLALVAMLDLSELRSLDDEVGATHLRDDASAYAVGRADAALLAILGRYVALSEEPASAVRVLTPLVRRELHFRLLTGPQGGMLRTLLRRDSHASHISRAIAELRRDFRAPLEIPALARSVGMSTSSFHKHFKVVTATTPLQYQKDLRLTEARRLLLGGEHSVSSAAFAVGYESPTQFSREYSRKYGIPPSDHLRTSALAFAT